MRQHPGQGYSPTHDPVLLGVVGFLAGVGTVLAYIIEVGSSVTLVFLLVAVLIVIWTMYLRARDAGPPES